VLPVDLLDSLDGVGRNRGVDRDARDRVTAQVRQHVIHCFFIFLLPGVIARPRVTPLTIQQPARENPRVNIG
jgi:hypothetical protein